MALTRTDLFDGRLLSIRRVVCRPAHPGMGDVEESDADTVVLPVRGVFVKHLAPHRQLLAEPTQALFFAAGRPYRVGHPTGSGDECLVLQFTPDTLRDALVDVAATDSLGHAALLPQATMPGTALAGRELLRGRIMRGTADALEVEETALALLSTAIAAARRAAPHRKDRPTTRVRRRQQTDAVRELLVADPAEKATLDDFARHVHTTPFHLARIFHDEIGLPIHQYRLRVRLARALELLLDTRQSVSRIALELGFSSHSHFTAAFRRMAGMTPRQFRGAARAAHVSEVRKNLIDPALPRR